MSTLTTPLTDADFDRLENLLERVSPDSMSLPELDGFLCALVSGPCRDPLSDFIPDILRIEPDVKVRYSLVDPGELRELLERQWNTIALALMANEPYIPFFVKDDEGNVDGAEWAEGFWLGMNAHRSGWSRLVNSREHWHLLGPVTVMMAENDPELAPELVNHLPSPEEHMEVLAAVVVSLREIFQFFHHPAAKSIGKRK